MQGHSEVQGQTVVKRQTQKCKVRQRCRDINARMDRRACRDVSACRRTDLRGQMRVHGFRRTQRRSGRVSGGQVPNSTELSADSGVKKDCEKFRSAEEKHQSDSGRTKMCV